MVKQKLDTLTIRDSTDEERKELREISKENVNNMTETTKVDNGDIIQMTPRSLYTDRDGFETNRSGTNQLTGLKPKALVFSSPLKSPVKTVT